MSEEEYNWRDDPGLECSPVYKRKFAILPVICENDTSVHFGHYYKKYISWSNNRDYLNNEDSHRHESFIENITEDEYITRKLADKL